MFQSPFSEESNHVRSTPTNHLDYEPVWVWEFGQPAVFLEHGGHVWDTAFDVRGTFGVRTENIDALEAASVPEPATLLIVASAATLLACLRERRK